MAEKELSPIEQDLVRLKVEELTMRNERTRQDHTKYLAMLRNQRTLQFAMRIDDQTVRGASSWLAEVAAESTDPITIEFMSPGGSVLAGLALYDAILQIRKRGIHVVTIGVGYTASMAGVLLQAGDERALTQNSYFHIHEVSSSAVGNVNEMKDEARFAETLWHHISVLLTERSPSWSDEALRDRVERRDWWMSAQEALDQGFVDRVI